MTYYDTYDWRKEYCQDHKPEEIETDSSYYVWLRKDFKEIKETVEPQDGEEFEPYEVTVRWEYMEKKITLSQYLAEQQKINQENVDTLMLGLVDLYETQLGGING